MGRGSAWGLENPILAIVSPVTCLRHKASWSGGEVLVLSAEAFERVTASDQEAKWQTSCSQTNLDLDLALSSSAKT
jgi:hypothetical protein